jgi:cytochrome c
MIRNLKVVAALAVATMAFAGPASAEGDAAAGETVFKKCAACHAVEADKNKGKQGPLLAGLFGRLALFHEVRAAELALDAEKALRLQRAPHLGRE